MLEKKGEQPPDNETMNIGHVIQLCSMDVFKMFADYLMVHETERGEVIHTNTAILYLRTALRQAKVRFEEHKGKMPARHVIRISEFFTCFGEGVED